MKPTSSIDQLAGRLSALIGQVRWTDRQTVDRDEVADYASLTAYEVSPGGTAPPGFGAVLTMRAVLLVLHDERLGLPFDANVHAGQELEWHSQLEIGTSVTTQAWLVDVKPRPRALFYDIATETRNADGRVCLRGNSVQAVRHV